MARLAKDHLGGGRVDLDHGLARARDADVFNRQTVGRPEALEVDGLSLVSRLVVVVAGEVGALLSPVTERLGWLDLIDTEPLHRARDHGGRRRRARFFFLRGWLRRFVLIFFVRQEVGARLLLLGWCWLRRRVGFLDDARVLALQQHLMEIVLSGDALDILFQGLVLQLDLFQLLGEQLVLGGGLLGLVFQPKNGGLLLRQLRLDLLVPLQHVEALLLPCLVLLLQPVARLHYVVHGF